MERLKVLVANEPRSYRDAMSMALERVRPGTEVLKVEPEALERAVAQCPGSSCVVLCSRLTPIVDARALSWVELYPSGESLANVSVLGDRAVFEDFRLEDLLSVIDRTALYLPPEPGP